MSPLAALPRGRVAFYNRRSGACRSRKAENGKPGEKARQREGTGLATGHPSPRAPPAGDPAGPRAHFSNKGGRPANQPAAIQDRSTS